MKMKLISKNWNIVRNSHPISPCSLQGIGRNRCLWISLVTVVGLFSFGNGLRAQVTVPVTNPSFETDAIQGANAPTFENRTTAPTGWTYAGGGTKGLLAPGSSGGSSFYSTTSGINGAKVHYAVGGATIQQTLSTTLQSNTIYTLTAAVGNRSGNAVSGWGGFHINVSTTSGKLVGDWTGFNGHIVPAGQFGDSKRTLTSGPNPVGAGEQLVITLGQEPTSGADLYFDVDNIRLTASAVPPQTNGTPIDVYIVSGQSNAKGNGAYTGALNPTKRHYADAPNTNVLFSYKIKELNETIYTAGSPARLSSTGAGYANYDGFGPELSMGTDVADQLHTPGFAIIKYAVGAAGLEADFKKSANRLYPIMLNFINQSLQHLRDQGYAPRLKACFWLQGEADAGDATLQNAVNYGANIKEFVRDLRTELNAPQMTFILTEINPAMPLLAAFPAGVALVNKGMTDLVAQDAGVFFVKVTDHTELLSGFYDIVHYNADQQILIGQLWAGAYLSSLTGPPPPPPSDLTANGAAADQINLTWADNSTNESVFLIERSSDNVTFTQIGFAAANETNYFDTGLAPATTFFYRVRASNSHGPSSYSNVASGTTLNSITLAAPGNVTASPGNRKIVLNWNAVAGATSYNVKRSAPSSGSYPTIASPVTTNYTDTGLVNGTTYYYVISAIAGAGEGSNSVPVSATPIGRPIAYYRFEQNALDSSGNNNDGAPVGGLLYGPGKVGANSAQFDGTSSFVVIPPVVRTNFTVAMWVRTTNTGTGSAWYNGMGLVDGEVTGVAADWGCSVLNSKFAIGIGNPDTTFYTTVNVNDGNWHHLVATRNSDTGMVKLYVDGVLNFTGTGATGPRTAPNHLRIGATWLPAPVILKGNLDDVRIYDEVLSAADIVALAYPRAPVIQSINLGGSIGLLGSSGSVALHGTGGNPNAQFLVLSSSNLVTQTAQWARASTNDFDGNGNFSTTNSTTVNAPAEFFRLQLY